MSPRQLLNRWMYPLETRQDFCFLNTGQQFAVPFDQLIIFATNLDPYGLADAAFLRRIRHKVFIGHVNVEQYMEIFRRVCEQQNIRFNPDVVREMDDLALLPGLPAHERLIPGTLSKTWWTGPDS